MSSFVFLFLLLSFAFFSFFLLGFLHLIIIGGSNAATVSQETEEQVARKDRE